MDRKTVILLVASFGALFLWQYLVSVWFPPVPKPIGATNLVSSVTNGMSTNAVAGTTNIAPPAIASAKVTAQPIVLATNVPEQIEVLESPEAIYTFTSRGGGLNQIQLKHYLETVGCDRANGTNQFATLNDHARVSVFAMQAGDAFGDDSFKLTRTSDSTVKAEKTLPSGLRVVNEFVLGSDYRVTARQRIENTSAQAFILPPQQLSAGTATPMGPRDPMTAMGVFYFNGEKAEHVEQSWFDGGAGCSKKAARLDYGPMTNRIVWAAVHNQFFTIAVVPGTNAIGSQFAAHRIDLPTPSAQEIAADSKVIREPRGLEAIIGYPAINLAANQAVDREFTIYAGPKQEKLLAKAGRGTDAIMDFGFWSPISKIMLRAMNLIHRLIAPIIPERLGKYAMSLVLMTILIKAVFWPLTQKSTRSMKKMQALAPEMKKIQEKYKDDPMKMNKKVMEFYRENKVSPMSGCWPMMIQLPIFFALFRMIPNAIELRGTPFLWACDLSKPDSIFMLPGLNYPVNPLPLIMGVTMLVQARMQPPSPGMDPAQQTMMKYMPLMFLVFLYNQPAGLTLYWTVQNLLTIVQTKLTKAKEQPAAAPVGPLSPKKKK